MQDTLVRLVYASRSTADIHQLKTNLSQILITAHRQNLRHQIVGVLFYGNGYFLQCIEGQQHHVDSLYAVIQKDPRHENITLIDRHYIDRCQFSTWQMKYVQLDDQVKHFLEQRNLLPFNPFNLSLPTVKTLIDHLYDQQDHAEQAKTFDQQPNPQMVMSHHTLEPHISKFSLILFAAITFICGILLCLYYYTSTP